MLASLQWHLDEVHDPFHDPFGRNAVLNACRALHYLATERFVSKRVGAEWFMTTQSVPVVVEALECRRRQSAVRLEHNEVVSFLRRAIAEFEFRHCLTGAASSDPAANRSPLR